MDSPNTRERKALRALVGEPWEYRAKLYGAGKGTIDSIVAKGWAEFLPPLPSGIERMRITAAGEAALADPQSSPPTKPRPRLKPLPPLLKELPPMLKPRA